MKNQIIRHKISLYTRFLAPLLALALFGHSIQAIAAPQVISSSTKAQSLAPDSIYNLDSVWKNQSGEVLHWQDFRGKPVIVTMAYTGCAYTCPMIISKLQQIESELKAKGQTDYRIVIASFDHEKDRPNHLKEYMAKRKIESSRWSMVVAETASNTRELAVLLGINFKPEQGGHFSHSNVISLLDSEGRISSQLNGIQADHKEFVQKVGK